MVIATVWLIVVVWPVSAGQSAEPGPSGLTALPENQTKLYAYSTFYIILCGRRKVAAAATIAAQAEYAWQEFQTGENPFKIHIEIYRARI